MMKKVLYILFTSIALVSCKQGPSPFDGKFEDVVQSTNTIEIKHQSGKMYKLLSASGKKEVILEQQGRKLMGIFSGDKISCEFTPGFDTVVCKINGDLSMICKRQKK